MNTYETQINLAPNWTSPVLENLQIIFTVDFDYHPADSNDRMSCDESVTVNEVTPDSVFSRDQKIASRLGSDIYLLELISDYQLAAARLVNYLDDFDQLADDILRSRYDL